MPLYEYECRECEKITEAIREPTKRRRTPKCRHCNGKTRIIISHTTFVLTGGGWADSGYGNKK